MNERAYERRLKQLRKVLDLNAPPVILAHVCIGVAATATGDGTQTGLIRYILNWRREVLRMADPETEEGKELEALIKEVDDFELEEAAQGFIG